MRGDGAGVVVDGDAAGGHHDAAVGDRDSVGSKAMPALPSSLAIRPQYGSSPYHEHLHRAGCWRPGAAPRAASSSLARADDLDAHDLGGALGVAGHLRGQRRTGLGRRAEPSSSLVDRPGRRRWPAGSRCRWSTCSRRSTSALKLALDGPLRAPLQLVGLGRGVGGEHGEHRRHVRREHGRALGHAADGGRRRRTSVSLRRCRWSDRLGRGGAALGRRGPRSAGMPAAITSIGSGMPIRPVEQTSTSSARAARVPAPSPRTCARRASRPPSPVAALALPLLRIDGRRPPAACREVAPAT